MDLSLMPEEIAEELGVEFDSVKASATGSTKALPEKLRPAEIGVDYTDEDSDFFAEQTGGLVSQLLAANWENAPDSLKEDINKFLDEELSRSLAIVQPVSGGVKLKDKPARLRTPDHSSDAEGTSSSVVNFMNEDTLWGEDLDLDELIS